MALHYDRHWQAVRKTRALSSILIAALVSSLLPAPDASGAQSTRDNIAGHAHGQRVYTMSPEEYTQVAPTLRRGQIEGSLSVITLADASTSQPTTTETNAATHAVSGAATNTVTQPQRVYPNPFPAPVAVHHPHPPPHTAHVAANLLAELGSPGWADSDAAIVIFIVIGVTVVATVIVYAGVFLYQAVTGWGDHSYWWDIEAHSSVVIESGDTGHLTGLKLSSGFENSMARVGLVLEGGYVDISVLPDDAPPPEAPQEERQPNRNEPPPLMTGAKDIDVAGSFLMAGAGVRWPFGRDGWNAHFFSLELLAGGVSDEDVDLISTARADLSFAIGKNLRIGASLGALYLQLNTEDGLLEDYDSFATLLGLHAGFRF